MMVPNVPLVDGVNLWVLFGVPVVLSSLAGLAMARIDRALRRPAGGAVEELPATRTEESTAAA